MISTASVVLALAASASEPSFWPQWRGPLASGVSPDAAPPIEWSEEKNIAWKVEVPGRGKGSPVVWGDRIFLLTAEPSASAPPRRIEDPTGSHPSVAPSSEVLRFTVRALSRKDGRTLWSKVVREEQPHDGAHHDGSFASSSASTDGERVFAYFGSRGLHALDFEGRPIWEKDFGDLAIRRSFGEGSTPVLHGDKVVVLWDHQGHSFIAALDKRTGREIWRTERDEITSWTTPLVVEEGGRAQVVTSATKRVRSYDLNNGRLLWESEGVTLNAIPSPVGGGGMVYVTSGFQGSVLRAIRLSRAQGDVKETDAIAWSLDRNTPYVPSPLLYEDTLYVLKSNSGILTCLDAATGVVHFTRRIDGVLNVYASPVGAAGRVYVVGRDGTTAVLERGREYRLLAVNQLDDGFDASPALVDGEMYLRGIRFLYRVSMDSTSERGAKGTEHQ
jgi:outer membrane protein assembly factor BamB